jgi:hypothetical protein
MNRICFGPSTYEFKDCYIGDAEATGAPGASAVRAEDIGVRSVEDGGTAAENTAAMNAFMAGDGSPSITAEMVSAGSFEIEDSRSADSVSAAVRVYRAMWAARPKGA